MMTITFPEIVTLKNINKLKKMVENGRNTYPGANTVIQVIKKPDGSKELIRFDLRFRKNTDIKISDIVERHLLNGDVVLFNRQPTLHKQSMMAHKIKGGHEGSFGLNVDITTPYNADYDGDKQSCLQQRTAF